MKEFIKKLGNAVNEIQFEENIWAYWNTDEGKEQIHIDTEEVWSNFNILAKKGIKMLSFLDTLLSNEEVKKMLPLFIGIDDVTDEIIAELLKK